MKSKRKEHKREKVVTLSLSGRITIGDGDNDLREVVSDEVNSGWLNVVLDLGGVTAFDASGVGELRGCDTTVRNRGGKGLHLLNVPPKFLGQIMGTGIPVFGTEAEAVADF